MLQVFSSSTSFNLDTLDLCALSSIILDLQTFPTVSNAAANTSLARIISELQFYGKERGTERQSEIDSFTFYLTWLTRFLLGLVPASES